MTGKFLSQALQSAAKYFGYGESESPDESLIAAAHTALSPYLDAFELTWPRPALADAPGGAAIAGASPEEQAAIVVAALDVLLAANDECAREMKRRGTMNFRFRAWQYRMAMLELLPSLLRRKLPFTSAAIDAILARMVRANSRTSWNPFPTGSVLRAVERYSNDHSLTKEQRLMLLKVKNVLEPDGLNAESRKLARRIACLLGEEKRCILEPGEAWADVALERLGRMSGDERALWMALFAHCQASGSSRPSAKWRSEAQKHVDSIGEDDARSLICTWLPLIDKPRNTPMRRNPEWFTNIIIDPHADLLRGLIWSLAPIADAEVARTLRAVAISAYRKLPGLGPRCVKVGNACIYALGNMPGDDGVAQLAVLKSRIKLRNVQKEIEKALTAAAARISISREDLEEMSIPTYGLTEVGLLREQLGEFTAELRVTGTPSTELRWINAKGKAQKSVPAAVKKDHAEDVKDLKAAAKDIERMLPAQRDRLDRLMLHRKTWPLHVWRERYLDHPLVGTLARRLIWVIEQDGESRAVIFSGGAFSDVDGNVLTPRETASVELWHPIHASAEVVQAWRARLAALQIVQPFKQAHREIYLLTDAERATRTYSNRFAAHIIRQHQFNALAAARGWSNKLRLMVDDEYPPATLLLPEHNLRAEFWIEGIGDEYGADTNDTGTYLYLATDQVRFYRAAAHQRMAHAGGGGYHTRYGVETDEPLPLEEIPPLVFSEVMRDVDLFVGVAGVGNDPTWFDGRSTAQATYWHNVSFGDLSATAHTRREVLARLIPRLAIADRCSFSERFLIVRGDLRTYKIHLGSGNILMEPNDQYLCIVANAGAGRGKDEIFLPFEGDRTLSIILSKAIMLAADRTIKDPTIVGQIKLR